MPAFRHSRIADFRIPIPEEREMSKLATDVLYPPAADEACWEVFHENSKTERHDRPPSSEAVRKRMAEIAPSLPFDGYPVFHLPPPTLPETPLGDAIRARATGRDMVTCELSLEQLSAMLFCAYGETRDNEGTPFPRPFRTVPSGGALFPLDIFVHSARVAGLPPGVFYFDPTVHGLKLIRKGDHTHRMSEMFVQPELPLDSAVQLFITAFFERTTFKYRDRGYRFALLEAGHVAQNFNLAATALGLAVTCVGGFFDRALDSFLGLDGVTRSTVYVQAAGGRGGAATAQEW
jgi:SagB-type dehydrogenase family enzyme